jgi:hypothetical protein
MVKRKIKPKANNNGVCLVKIPAHNVAIQLNTLIPVGIAIIIVAPIK